MERTAAARPPLLPERPALVLAAAVTLFHLLTTHGYGIFRDELYYLACGAHLDWGYVDQPPLVALGAAFVRHVLGTSLFAVRLLPAIAGGLLVLLGAAIARQLGGGRFAQSLTALSVALAPFTIGIMSIYSMNAFDQVVWSAMILTLARILATDDRRLWLVFGALAGLGLENKISVLFLGLGLGVGLVATPARVHLRDRRLWLGALLAALLFLPHLLWQQTHGWPTAEFIRRATLYKNVAFGPLAFLAEQVKLMNPVTAPLWMAGVGALFVRRDLRPFRALAWAYPVIFVLLVTRGAKPYYLAPIYPLLFAAGALALERVTTRAGRRWICGGAIAIVAVTGAMLAPLAKPLLSEDRFVAYSSGLGIRPGTDERHEMGRLPQFFADMHGWRAMAEAVAEVCDALPPEDRARACIYAQNYGEAGAMELFGPELGLPPVVSGHNSYWLWGPGSCTGEVVVIIGGRREDHEATFRTVEAAGRFTCRDCMPYEDDLPLWVARGSRIPVGEVWERVRHFD